VQEQAAASQAEKENRGREIEQLKAENQQLQNDRTEQAKTLTSLREQNARVEKEKQH